MFSLEAIFAIGRLEHVRRLDKKSLFPLYKEESRFHASYFAVITIMTRTIPLSLLFILLTNISFACSKQLKVTIPAPSKDHSQSIKFRDLNGMMVENDDTTSHQKNRTMIEIDMFAPKGTLYPIENELFCGQLCIRHYKDGYSNAAEDFSFPEVYWEIQVQGKFKRVPSGALYLGVEPIWSSDSSANNKEVKSVPWHLKSVLTIFVNFMKSWGYKWFYISYGDDNDGSPPMMAAPLFQSLRRIHIAKSDGVIPQLGVLIEEDDDIQAARKVLANDDVIQLDNTYTFSFDNCYFEPFEWKVLRVPLVKEFDARKVAPKLRFSFYEVQGDDEPPTNGATNVVTSTKHLIRQEFFSIELEIDRV